MGSNRSSPTVPAAAAVFSEAEMVLKVKEPQEPEVALLRRLRQTFLYRLRGMDLDDLRLMFVR